MKYSLIAFILLMIIFSCNRNKIESNVGDFNYQKAKKFRDSGVTDSAFYYYNIAKSNYIKTNDSLNVGKSLVNMAIIQTKNGDFFGGIESSLEANNFLKREKDSTTRSTLATNYNNIALSFNFLRNFEKSLEFYFKTLKYIDNEEAKFLCYNNIGDVLITQQKYKLAEKYLEKAVVSKDSIYYSKALNNLAKSKYLDNENYNPLPQLHKALKIRIKKNDLEGLNSSYETLSEYFIKKDSDSSLYFAKKMLETANNIKIPSNQILALRKIIELDSHNYLINFKKYNSIISTLQTTRNKAKNQFAIIRYDVEKLKTEKAEKEVEVLQRNIGIIALLFTLIAGAFYYKKHKQRMLLESENRLQEQQIRTSKKVHDKVANKVYHVMSEVENTENMNKEVLLYKLDGIYQISRDISYEKNDVALEHNFSQHLSQMLKSYSSETIKVPIIGNEESLWEDIPDNSKVEIFYILQELMTNMKKHSKADKVLLDFSRENGLINISYSDNGVGISTHSPKNGLQNTESRINSIGGTINFDTKTESGLKINLSFPVKN
ncbi:hypothetical protein LNP04_10720 [Chryseobacterium sp. C-71]|uniref:tetratricopeptide repeat-containing sensor histidine kinase n=1 Tax=Chryseobacterium sp. C-71 TaxID=2893882 RepID=UPI001E54E437|nr:hypothetical protein [Chryseobacterium sp. C-71]UFH30453.1 hypothetical protein LNP04_10720 [Chryseobacterium sp. C-71]